MLLVKLGHQLEVVVQDQLSWAALLEPLNHLLDLVDCVVHLNHALQDVLQLVSLYTALVVDAVEGKVLPALILKLFWHPT